MHWSFAVQQGRFLVGLTVMVAVTVAIAGRAGIGLGWRPLGALVRATVQLAVIALLLRGVLNVPSAVVAFVALMATTATVTAASRLRELDMGRRTTVAGVLSGAAAGVGGALLLGLVEVDIRHVIAITGIVIGSAMTASTLAGRHFLAGCRHRSDEIEAWLSLGATPAQAHLDIGRQAARESLLANLDQTRSTGLVTLPGAFVGALFGGASPWQAARFQLAILAAILLAMTVTAVIVTRLAGRTRFLVTAQAR